MYERKQELPSHRAIIYLRDFNGFASKKKKRSKVAVSIVNFLAGVGVLVCVLCCGKILFGLSYRNLAILYFCAVMYKRGKLQVLP